MSAPDTTLDATSSLGPESSSSELLVAFDEKLPHGLGKVFVGGDDVLATLEKENDWLKLLGSNKEIDLSKLQTKYLEDPYAFMRILIEYLQLRKWHEFLFQWCCFDSHYSPVFLALLHFVFLKNGPVAVDTIMLNLRLKNPWHHTEISQNSATSSGNFDQDMMQQTFWTVRGKRLLKPFRRRYSTTDNRQ